MIKLISSQKVSYDPFRSGKVEKAILATQSQREMWSTLILSADANICYNEVISMEISGKISAEKLDQAFQELLRRHEALRASFSDDGKFFIIHEYHYQKLNVSDTTEREFEELKAKEVEIPFDLKNGPLVRAQLVRISPNKSYFIFSAHHIICDGWSLAIILTELTRAYEGKTLLPPSSFVEFALKESSAGINQADRAYWLGQFKTPFAGNNLPLDFSRPQFRTYESSRYDLEVSPSLVSSLKKFSAKNRISFYTLLMGSFSILLSKISGQSDVVVGMATAAQSIPGNEEVVGHLVNMLPIRSKVDGGIKSTDYLQELKKLMMDGIDHQCYTFGSLLQDLNLKRNPAEIPLVNVVFNIDQQLPGQGLEFDTLSAHYKSVPRIKENFEIFINAVNRGDELTIECQYNKNLFKEETIKNWLNSFIKLLNLVNNSDELIADLIINDLFIPNKCSHTPVTKVVPQTIHHQVEERLAKVWSKILSKEVGPLDNFFSLGGHSLLVVDMINHIEEEFHKKLSARQIFENPTIRELSQILAEKPTSKVEQISPVAESKHYLVSQNQMQVWYLEEIFHATNMHNLPSSIELKFAVNVAALEKAFNALIKRHEAFRTSISVEEGLPVAVISKEAPLYKLALVDISEKDIKNKLEHLASEPIPKNQAPLFSAKLFKLANNHFVLFFMPHHIIWDGWSFDIFFEELNTAYSAFAKLETPQFKALSASYKDYAHWLNLQVMSGKLEHEKAFWKERLKSPLPVLDLTSDKRPAQINYQGETFPFELDSSLITQLSDFAQDNGVSLYNVLLTAFKLSLAKFSYNEDIIVGTPVRCRNFPSLLNVIGYFVNTVALRTRVNQNDGFIANLQRVAQTTIEAFDHDQLPFQEVLKLVDIPRDASRTPIYQAFFSYQDVTGRKPLLDGHPYQQINVHKNTTHTDLDLWIKAGKTKVEGAFEYRSALISTDLITEFYSYFISLLENASSSAKSAHSEASPEALSSSDLHSFVSMFEQMASVYPNKLAIKSEVSRLSYETLNEKANQFANSLIASGVKSGDLVGISITRKVEMLISLLGVLKVGAGYVPLDPGFPQERLDYMIENSNIKVLITELQLQGRFNPYLTKLTLETLMESSHSKDNLNRHIPLTHTAYVIYTSGSTGKPKGVDVSHAGLANFLVSMSKTPGISQRDSLLAVTTLSFDIAGLELFLPLITGASIYLASSYDVIDGQALRSIIEKHSITYMQATPSTWRLLLAAGWRGDPAFKILCGGEAFPKDLAAKLIPMVESVWNMYGPTETTIWSTCKKLEAHQSVITVGTPIDNTTVYILDENRRILSPGEEGELFIGGMGLAKGYFNRPDLTEERFIPHPENPAEKIYATGDLAKINEYGELEVLGRLDGQVKVRGYRIELGEIEAQLNELEEIELSAAITKEVRKGDARIIAFYVVKKGMNIHESNLRQRLTETLPKYMVPSHFVLIEKIPQTLNGKIDKKSLGELFVLEESAYVEKEVTPQITHSKDVEEIREIWKQVLSVNTINDEDNFFDIGGNSLLAVDLSNRMAKHLGKSFQLSVLLHNPDFINFARHFTQTISDSVALLNSKYLVPIKKSGNQTPLFCVHTVGGNVLNYIQLAPAMGERPLYGIQSTGLVDSYHPGTIEEMARLYIQEMKILQPQGPYLIAGGSMGGMIALEIAQQLLQAGEKVDRLIMFDTFGPDFDITKYKDDQRSRWANFTAMMDYYYRMVKLQLKRRVLSFLGAPETLEMRLFDLEIKNYYTLWKYRPKSYEGDLYLIRNQMKEKGWYSDQYLGWRKLIKGDIHLSYIDASHSTFIESKDLIEALRKVL